MSHTIIRTIRSELSARLSGVPETIDFSLAALLARGHLLVEDVPGIGKTTLARTLASLIGGVSKRIQFTSDLLPTDILGVTTFISQRGDFEFRRGPVFANIIVADELNRGSPKAQSAFLEAMGEGCVTVDGQRHPLPKPFFVIATQNPFERSGVYPLIDSQLDRFTFKIRMGYPDAGGELAAMDKGWNPSEEPTVVPVAEPSAIIALQREVDHVKFPRPLLEYLQQLAHHTRERGELGVSPRALIQTAQAIRALALVKGHEAVIPDDVKAVVPVALIHRMPSGEAAIREALEDVPIP